MKHKVSLFLPLALLLIGIFALSTGGGVASAASRPSLTNAQVKSVPAGASLAKAALVSPDITRVNCGTRTDWLRIWGNYNTWTGCFANAGTINVNIYNADKISGGHNAGVVYWYGGYTYFSKGGCCAHIDYGNFVHVYAITIY